MRTIFAKLSTRQMIYREDGTLADKKGFFDKKVIDKIIG